MKEYLVFLLTSGFGRACLIALLILFGGMAGNADLVEAKRSHREYCKRVDEGVHSDYDRICVKEDGHWVVPKHER